MAKYKMVEGNPRPVFDPNIEDTTGMALAQMHAQGLRHVRGLGYVKLENPPPEFEVDPHDIEGYVFESPNAKTIYIPSITDKDGNTWLFPKGAI